MAISKFEPIPAQPVTSPLLPNGGRARPFGSRTTVAQFTFSTGDIDVPRGNIRVGVHTIDIDDVDYNGDHMGVKRVVFYRNISPALGRSFTLTIYGTVESSVRVTIWIRNPNWHPGQPDEERFLVGVCAGRLVKMDRLTK